MAGDCNSEPPWWQLYFVVILAICCCNSNSISSVVTDLGLGRFVEGDVGQVGGGSCRETGCTHGAMVWVHFGWSWVQTRQPRHSKLITVAQTAVSLSFSLKTHHLKGLTKSLDLDKFLSSSFHILFSQSKSGYKADQGLNIFRHQNLKETNSLS